jgi:prepilin-type processing-associated H-X9-DG protein
MTIKVAASVAAAALVTTVGVNWVSHMIPAAPGGARPATSVAMAADAPPDDGAAAAARALETANRVKCQRNLRQIGTAITLYANTNQGAYPPDLGTLAKTMDVALEVFCCPSAGTQPPANSTPDQAAKWVNQNSDYIYIGATMKTGAAPELVVAYEKDADHGGDGINMLFADGHVEFNNLQNAHQRIDDTKQKLGL